MSEESKDLSDIHLETYTPIYLDKDTSDTILDLYMMAAVSRGMDENTIVACYTAEDVYVFLHYLFCPEHMGESND